MLLEIFNPRNYYWNPWAAPVLLTAMVFILLGSFVGIRKKGMLNISFLIWAFLASFWLFGNSLAYMAKYDWVVIEMYNKFEFLGVCFISIAGYLVSISWDEHFFQKQKKYVIILSIISTIIYLTNLKFNYILSGVYHYFWGSYFKNGLGGTVFIIYWIIPFILTLINYLTLHKNAVGVKKRQYKLILIATFIAYLGATDWLPCYGLEIYPLGYIAILIFSLLTAYNIIRYRAFEIDTVVHRTLLWLVTSLWLVLPSYFLFKFTRYWLESLNTLWLTTAALGLFYLFLWHYRYFQPRIDHLFRRRKYDYQAILSKIAGKISTTINIEDLAHQLLGQVCETMYLRNSQLYVLSKDESKYSLFGKCGYNKIELNIHGEISSNSPLFQWVTRHQEILEKDQIQINPQFEEIKQEALKLFSEQELELLVPLILENKVNGLLGLGKKENLQIYSSKDIELLKKLGQETGVTIYNALHYKDLLEKDRLEEEMKLGREIQTALLPKESPRISTLFISGLMLPAKEIGGDYYDFITLPQKEELGIAIGDVSGKGVGAGLIMAAAKATLKGLSQQDLSPKQILTHTNNLIYEYTDGQKFITMLYFNYKAKERTLCYSSAGHEHILIYRALSSGVEAIISGGFMLGMLEDIEAYLENKVINLSIGDKILLYTDGVTEAESPSRERFGLKRLKESFKTHSLKAPFELIQAVKNDVYAFISTQPQYDDITLVGMEAK